MNEKVKLPSNVNWNPLRGSWEPSGDEFSKIFPAGFDVTILPTPRYTIGDKIRLKEKLYDTHEAIVERVTLHLAHRPTEDVDELKILLLQYFFDVEQIWKKGWKERGEDYQYSGLKDHIRYYLRMNGHLHIVYGFKIK